MSDFLGKDILSTKGMGKVDLEKIMETADEFAVFANKEKSSDLLKGKVLASLFYEPSTRTRLSFETAMQRLGGSVITVSGAEGSSLAKGETLRDTARVIENFADVMAVRHSLQGSADDMAEVAGIPVINAGDGHGEHPTQALLDIYTINKERGRVDGLTIAMVGDLKYGRTVHSLSYLLAHFGVKLILVSPDQLKMPAEITDFLAEKKIEFEVTENMDDAVKHAHVCYMTRVQQERFDDPAEYERFKNFYVLTKEIIEKYNSKMTIMHPLPRIGEISLNVDDLDGAAYFRQVKNGVAVRMALLAMVLGKA